MLTGYTSNFPSDVLLGTGILMIGATPLGALLDEPQFSPDFEIENTEFEGKVVKVKGLDRIFYDEPTFAGTLGEFGDSATGNQLAKLLPGVASASAGSPNVTTLTPASAGSFLASGNYLTDVRLMFERGIGTGTKKYFAVYFPCGLVVQWGPLRAGATKGKASCPFTIGARKDMGSGTLFDAPFKLELREATS